MIGPRHASIGERPHRVSLTGPTAVEPDGDGGWIEGRVALNPPQWSCRIQPGATATQERQGSGQQHTTAARASFIVTGPYRPDITTTTQLHHGPRTFYVTGVDSPDERYAETVCYCEERPIIPQAAPP